MFSITAMDSENKVVWLNVGFENDQHRPIRWVGSRDLASFFDDRSKADVAWERVKAYVSQAEHDFRCRNIQDNDFREHSLMTSFGIKATDCYLTEHCRSTFGWHNNTLQTIHIGI